MEQLVNRANSTLASAISAGATSLNVADGSVFPSVGNFTIIIDGELFVCTARSGNTFTVTGAQEGTVAAAHASGAAVTQVITNAVLRNLAIDYVGRGTYSSRPTALLNGRLYLPNDALTLARDDSTIWTPFGPLFR